MRKIICDRCQCEISGAKLVEKVDAGTHKWGFEIPRQFHDSNGFSRDVCYDCLRAILCDGCTVGEA